MKTATVMLFCGYVTVMKVKDIKLKVIPSKIANQFVKKYHYSGKVVPNSKLHFGAFYNNVLHGVMSYGSPLDKRRTIGLVKNTGWNEMLELNRMAFDDVLPKNSESRCIAISIRLIKKNAPHIKWILSFSDGCQCGDGTIYRASVFLLTNIKKNYCSEDCSFCSQSAFFNTKIDDYKLQPSEEIVKQAMTAKNNGANSFCLVAAWREPSDDDFENMNVTFKKTFAESVQTWQL